MSHTPPLPADAVAPFPAHPEPHGHPHGYAPRATDASRPPSTASDDKTRRVIAGAAVGIGSAAIVAALLYANRKPGKAVPKDYERAD